VAATGGAGRSEGTGTAATGLTAGGALRSCAGTGGEPPGPSTAPDPGAGKVPAGTDALRVPDVGSGTRSLGGSGTGRGALGGDAMGGGEGKARSRPGTATGGPTGAGGPTSRSGGFGTAGGSGDGGSCRAATMLGARGTSAACSGVRTAGAAGGAAGGAKATGGGGTGTPPGASAVSGRSLAAAPVSGGAGASAAAGGVPSAPADGGLEGTRLSEGRSGTAPTWVLPPAALLVTERMVERSFRLTTDESRDRRRASPPSPAATHNTTTMATEDQPRLAFRRPGLRGSGGRVVS
jgi:hypothetical protein